MRCSSSFFGNLKNTRAAPSRIATAPAAYAQSSPWRNDDFAAARISLEYLGFCAARFAALEYESCSWLCVLSETLCPSGEEAIAAPMAEAYPAASSAPKIEVSSAPPRSRCRSAVPEAMPGALDGDRPRERVRGRRPGEPDADPDEDVGEPDLPVGAALLPEEQHPEEGGEEEDVAEEQREAGAPRLDELRRARRDEDHEDDRGQDRGTGLDRRVAEHVLQVLLADERRRHQRAEDDDPGAGGDPERRAGGDLEVVERVLRPPLADQEGDRRGCGDREQAEREGALVGHRREVDPEDQRAHEHDREDAAEVVDRIGRLVHVARHEEQRHDQRDPTSGSVTRKTEPHSKYSSRPRR